MSGYSGTPLDRKLGLKAGMRVLFIGLPDHLADLTAVEGLAEVLTDWPADTSGARLDYIHVFETGRVSLETMMPRLLALVAPAGMIWISWPKKASKVPTSITEDVLREIFLPTRPCRREGLRSGRDLVRPQIRRAQGFAKHLA